MPVEACKVIYIQIYVYKYIRVYIHAYNVCTSVRVGVYVYLKYEEKRRMMTRHHDVRKVQKRMCASRNER